MHPHLKNFNFKQLFTQLKRREFLKNSIILSSSALLPTDFLHKNIPNLKIGIIADVHQDIIFDGTKRIKKFLKDANKFNVDFVIQLGDFALPRKVNQKFINTWNNYKGIKYHVLGNHDMVDFGFKKDQTMNWWGMKKRYYSFDKGGIHFIILDGNDKNPDDWNEYYYRYIGNEQKNWLENDLRNTSLPVIIFSHQSLDAKHGVKNRVEIRKIIENFKFENGIRKVVACISGHHHDDYNQSINGINYIHINSASYKWVGDKYKFSRFSKKIESKFPSITKTCPYKDSLYTFMTCDFDKGMITFEERKSEYIKPSPKDLGIPNSELMNPSISAMNFKNPLK